MGSRSVKHCNSTRKFWLGYRREKPWARKLVRRLERNRARRLLRAGRYDEADTRQTKGTQGWLTW